MRHTRRIATLLTALAAAFAVLFLYAGTGSAGAATSTTSSLTTPVTGTFTGTPGDAFGGSGTLAGDFTPGNVAEQGGALVMNGTLTGTLTGANGYVQQLAATPVTLPLQVAGTCQILHLTLGPLDLNLLGLTVHLDRVVLDISAQQGSGDLLGNLLCAVANLLNTGGSLSQIASLLNQILALLG
jgi:hypothetical protein